MQDWLINVRVLYYMFFYDRPFQAQLGVMAFLEACEWNAIRGCGMESSGTNEEDICTPRRQMCFHWLDCDMAINFDGLSDCVCHARE